MDSLSVGSACWSAPPPGEPTHVWDELPCPWIRRAWNLDAIADTALDVIIPMDTYGSNDTAFDWNMYQYKKFLNINRIGWGLYPTDMTGPINGAHTATYAAGRVSTISGYSGNSRESVNHQWLQRQLDLHLGSRPEPTRAAVGKLWAPWIPPFRAFLAGEEIELKTDDADFNGVDSPLKNSHATAHTAARHLQPACSNTSDCTAELQGALDSCAPEVVLTTLPSGRSWITRPLFVRHCEHSQRLELKPGVVLQAIKDGFHGGGDMLLQVANVTGFTLHGPGAFLRMHRADYNDPEKYSVAESRHALGVLGSADVTISGDPGRPLTEMESGGDGCFISNLGSGTALTNPRNITIHDVNFTRNYRQGISVRILWLAQLLVTLLVSRSLPPIAK